MKKILFLVTLAVAFTGLISCNDTETYADKRDKENDAIARFLRDSNIIVISEAQFEQQNYTTDLKKNEYVLFNASGVYMQIVRPGCGKKIESGDKVTVLTRFYEFNILGDSAQANNMNIDLAAYPERMLVYNTSGTFTGVFDTSVYSHMTNTYNSTAVPAGWLVPLRYVKVGRQTTEDEEIAKVKVIVPAAQGQAYASQSVYPCFYLLTYESER